MIAFEFNQQNDHAIVTHMQFARSGYLQSRRLSRFLHLFAIAVTVLRQRQKRHCVSDIAWLPTDREIIIGPDGDVVEGDTEVSFVDGERKRSCREVGCQRHCVAIPESAAKSFRVSKIVRVAALAVYAVVELVERVVVAAVFVTRKANKHAVLHSSDPDLP